MSLEADNQESGDQFEGRVWKAPVLTLLNVGNGTQDGNVSGLDTGGGTSGASMSAS